MLATKGLRASLIARSVLVLLPMYFAFRIACCIGFNSLNLQFMKRSNQNSLLQWFLRITSSGKKAKPFLLCEWEDKSVGVSISRKLKPRLRWTDLEFRQEVHRQNLKIKCAKEARYVDALWYRRKSNGVSDPSTDGRTDKPFYTAASPHLKTEPNAPTDRYLGYSTDWHWHHWQALGF